MTSADFTDAYALESVGSSAFAGTKITEVKFPNQNSDDGTHLTSIAVGAFATSTLKTVYLPYSLETIPDEAFSNCTGLEEVSFTHNMKAIGKSAFSNCKSLEELRFDTNSNLETIGESAFYGCKSLTDINMKNSVDLSTIGDRAFAYCDFLDTVIFPVGLTTIGEEAFYLCDHLKTCLCSDETSGSSVKLKSIGDSAFYGCTVLTEMTIPKSVTNIGDMAFAMCKSVFVESGNSAYHTKDGVLYNNDENV